MRRVGLKDVSCMSPLGKSNHGTVKVEVMGEAEVNLGEDTRKIGGIMEGQNFVELLEFWQSKLKDVEELEFLYLWEGNNEIGTDAQKSEKKEKMIGLLESAYG